jgi:hypothetical protein
MGYEEVWKVLADLITDLRERGERIPANVMNDLRSAKTMIQILKADPAYTENLPRIETYLGDVESYLIFLAQNRFGSDYVEQWMEKLERARREIYEEGEPRVVSRFVPGLPRGERWVRVQVSEDAPQKAIERLAEENKLSCKMQDDGYMLVSGDVERIKAFVAQMKRTFFKRG